MSDVLASVSIVLGADISEFKAAMATAKSELKGLVQFGEGLKNVGESMTKFLTLPIALFGVEAVRAFSDSDKAIAAVENGLRSTGNAAKITSQQFQELAAQMQTKSVFKDDEILAKVTTQLLTFSNISGETFKRTQQAAVDLSSKLGQDLQTSAIQLGKALNDPTQSLGALRRAGISFSNDQIAVIKSLQATGQLGKAQTIILGELERQYGGTAEAAAKAGTGPMKQLANQFNDLEESIGKIIIDAINPFIAKLSGLVKAFIDLSPATKSTIVTVLAVVAAMGPLLFILGGLITLLPALTAGFALLSSSLAGLAAPILLTAAAVALVVYEIYQHWDELVAYFSPSGEGGKVFSDLAAAIKDAFATIQSVFSNFNKSDNFGDMITVTGVLKGAFVALAVAITSVFSYASGIIKAVIGLLSGDLPTAADGAVQAFNALLAPLENLLGLQRKVAETTEVSTSGVLAARTQVGLYGDVLGLAVPKVRDFTGAILSSGEAAKLLGEKTDEAFAKLDKNAIKAAKKLAEELAKLAQELRTNTILAANLPASFKTGEGAYDAVGERIKILTAGLKSLVADGLSPASAAFQKYLKELLSLEQGKDIKLAAPQVATGRTTEDELKAPVIKKVKVDFSGDVYTELQKVADAFKQADNEAIAFGDETNVLGAKTAALQTAITNLLKAGVSPLAPAITKLSDQLKELGKTGTEIGKLIRENLAGAFASLGASIGSALGNGNDVLHAIFESLLKTVSDFMVKYGEKLILLGLGDAAAGNYVKGGLEIVAGTALIAGAGAASGAGGSGGGGGGGGGGNSFNPQAARSFVPTTAPKTDVKGPAAIIEHRIEMVAHGPSLRGVLAYEVDRLGRVLGTH